MPPCPRKNVRSGTHREFPVFLKVPKYVPHNRPPTTAVKAVRSCPCPRNQRRLRGKIFSNSLSDGKSFPCRINIRAGIQGLCPRLRGARTPQPLPTNCFLPIKLFHHDKRIFAVAVIARPRILPDKTVLYIQRHGRRIGDAHFQKQALYPRLCGQL